MATSHIFNGKRYRLPGAYAATKADVTPSAVSADYSHVLVIDTGLCKGWSAGASSISEHERRSNGGLKRFRSPSDMRDFLKGGPMYPLADALFRPSALRDTPGTSDVFFISAKETKASSLKLIFNDRGDFNDDFNNDYKNEESEYPFIELISRNEGEWGNGVVNDEGGLLIGYGALVEKGVRDPKKYIVNILQGTFTGRKEDDELPFDEIYPKDAIPRLIAKSPELETYEDFEKWFSRDENLHSRFFIGENKLKGKIYMLKDTLLLAEGGSDTYTPKAFEKALDICKNTSAYFIMSDQKLDHANNHRLQSWSSNEVKFSNVVIIPGGDDSSEFKDTIEATKSFNSDNVRIVYNGIKLPSAIGIDGERAYSSFIHAGYLVGREAGLLPQVPMTFKEIDIKDLATPISTEQLEDCLDYGIMTTYYDDDLDRFCCLKGVNTLQNNLQMINPDGSTHSTQCRRIADYINKEMIIDAKRELFTQREGMTTTSLSERFVKDWVVLKLRQKVDRDLIARFDQASVEVVRDKDAYFVNYKFAPNHEINFMFLTGFMIN